MGKQVAARFIKAGFTSDQRLQIQDAVVSDG